MQVLKTTKEALHEIDLELAQLIRRRCAIIDPELVEQLTDSTIGSAIDSILKSIGLPLDQKQTRLLISRGIQTQDTKIKIKGIEIGGGGPHVIAGPCSIESESQMIQTARSLKQNGISLLRGGAYKPRTSPYAFQGLGEPALKLLRRVADKFDMIAVSEIMSPSELHLAEAYLDIIQIGSRNMYNYELLKAVGRTNIPVLLKRGLSATIEEFMLAAEYIMLGGNERIILCERGIRTYEQATRNTLDISAVPILKQETHLPVFVDVSHATGRRDILLPCARAALAAGADGIMLEVHPDPETALSDAEQQIDFSTFNSLITKLRQNCYYSYSK